MTDNATLYRRWILELWKGDFAVAEEILAPDFVGHWPTMEVHGPEEAVEQIRMSHDYFHDIEVTLDIGPMVDGVMVAARWTFHGAYTGGIPGATVEPGTRVSFAGHDIFRVVEGRLAEYWVISDALGMMRALGALG